MFSELRSDVANFFDERLDTTLAGWETVLPFDGLQSDETVFPLITVDLVTVPVFAPMRGIVGNEFEISLELAVRGYVNTLEAGGESSEDLVGLLMAPDKSAGLYRALLDLSKTSLVSDTGRKWLLTVGTGRRIKPTERPQMRYSDGVEVLITAYSKG